MEDEAGPPNKRVKTEENLIPEDVFLARASQVRSVGPEPATSTAVHWFCVQEEGLLSTLAMVVNCADSLEGLMAIA